MENEQWQCKEIRDHLTISERRCIVLQNEKEELSAHVEAVRQLL